MNDEARRLFAGPCDYMISASEPAHLDALPGQAPEVAFWGRSNVGKSSLINALTGRKRLARTSNTPGRTRQINFFNLGDRLMLADLPGYGHAKASKQDIIQWNGFIRTYLKMRARLACVVLLIDGRHGLKPIDEEKMAFLDEMAVSYQIVLTKADKNENDIGSLCEDIEKKLKKHPAARPGILVTSAQDPLTLEPLRLFLGQIALKC